MKTILISAALAISLTACVSSGVRVTGEQTATLKRGETTRTEVLAAFGKPTTQVRRADGSTMLMYMYTEAASRPESFIPIAGAFLGGMDMRSNHVTLVFDPNDTLTDYTSAETETGTGFGARTGAVDRVVDQPRR